MDRDDLELTLMDNRAWRADPGSLLITAVNSRGDEGGWVDMPGEGIHIAEILEDIDADLTGGVEVFPMGVKVYQSALQERITITGTGFKDGIDFTFEPALKAGIDYEMEVESKNQISLRLKRYSLPPFTLSYSLLPYLTLSHHLLLSLRPLLVARSGDPRPAFSSPNPSS